MLVLAKIYTLSWMQRSHERESILRPSVESQRNTHSLKLVNIVLMWLRGKEQRRSHLTYITVQLDMPLTHLTGQTLHQSCKPLQLPKL